MLGFEALRGRGLGPSPLGFGPLVVHLRLPSPLARTGLVGDALLGFEALRGRGLGFARVVATWRGRQTRASVHYTAAAWTWRGRQTGVRLGCEVKTCGITQTFCTTRARAMRSIAKRELARKSCTVDGDRVYSVSCSPCLSVIVCALRHALQDSKGACKGDNIPLCRVTVRALYRVFVLSCVILSTVQL